MALFSMTGFARVAVEAGANRYVWELKSVNGRGLDVRMRLPAGFDRLEPDLRRLARSAISRGNCTFNLQADRASADQLFQLNESALALAVAVAKRLAGVDGIAPPSADGILAIPGVIQPANGGDGQLTDALTMAVLSKFREALDALRAARAEEGKRLLALVGGQLDQIAALVSQAVKLAEEAGDGLKARIGDQVARLKSENGLDPDRLHQEAMLLAIKADVREEIDRLGGHVSAAREQLATDGAVGRRLDFLAQEMNREANTICAKAFDRRMTAVGVDMKTVIDQFREQVQNIE